MASLSLQFYELFGATAAGAGAIYGGTQTMARLKWAAVVTTG